MSKIVGGAVSASISRMAVFLIVLFVLQLLVTVIALIFERREDPRFEGDKLKYWS